MILQRDVPLIRPWLITCGSRDFRNPNIKHTPIQVFEIYKEWAELLQKNGHYPFPIECIAITEGTVTFMREETAGRGTFEGMQIRGVSLFEKELTRKMLHDFSAYLLKALGQEVLEFHDDFGISCVRLNEGVPIRANA